MMDEVLDKNIVPNDAQKKYAITLDVNNQCQLELDVILFAHDQQNE